MTAMWLLRCVERMTMTMARKFLDDEGREGVSGKTAR
jgi:hypothetical protein